MRLHLLNFNPLPSYEGRLGAEIIKLTTEQISIHSPHTRGDCSFFFCSANQSSFQSTPLIRGETSGFQNKAPPQNHFNPLPSYEGRLALESGEKGKSKFQSTPLIRGETAEAVRLVLTNLFQSTPLIRGETAKKARLERLHLSFQSTPLIRGETDADDRRGAQDRISIHSPHTRGDLRRCAGLRAKHIISIHSPHTRGDVIIGGSLSRKRRFQSTPLIRGETVERILDGEDWEFQSTPLIRGETIAGHAHDFTGTEFQSTPLIRGETADSSRARWCIAISIHSPHTRGDKSSKRDTRGTTFQSTPLIRGETRETGEKI